MDSETKHLPDLALRVEALERSNRRLQRRLAVAVASLACLPLLLLTAAACGSGAEEVRAERFLLLDAKGRTRGLWQCSENGHPELVFQDEEGKERLAVRMSDDDVSEVIRDSEGRVRLGLSVDAMGHPHFLLSGLRGEPRLHMAINSKGSPTLLCRGSDGSLVSGIGVLDDDRPWLKPGPGAAPVAPEKKEKR
jgi:hypothetical protein